jgi:hypothetical protein
MPEQVDYPDVASASRVKALPAHKLDTPSSEACTNAEQ